MKEFSLTIERATGGQIVVSAIINNQRVHRQYFWYPVNEAITKFLNEFGLIENSLEE